MLRSLLLTVLAVGVVGAGALGFGAFAPSADGGDLADEQFPTATDDGSSSGDGTSTAATGTATPVAEPFAVTVDDVETCGTTCRDVTVSLVNRQSGDATGVEVYTRVFAGNSTDESELVWSGQESVGRLEAGATHATTKRVELTYAEALAVRDADGWVTVQTTVRTDDRTVTFTERRQVS